VRGTITLSASARFGFGGKQFVARVTGRHPKFTFQYEFMGRKEGKRGESTSVEVDDAGLYVTRDVDSKGRADDSFALVYTKTDGELAKHWIDKSDAMKLAKRLDARDAIDWTAEGTAYEPKPAPPVEAPTLAPDIAGALASALQAIKDERETHAAMLDRLGGFVNAAAQQHAAGDIAAAHLNCKEALDLAHLALGECDAIEPLAAMLGYEDPDPVAAPTKGGAS